MSSVTLTVRVKEAKAKTASDKVQPGKSGGDEKINDTVNLLGMTKAAFAVKAAKQVISMAEDQVSFEIYKTGNTYYQSAFSATKKIYNIVKNPIGTTYDYIMWSRKRNFDLMWENRNAEQAARRAGNYLTGNSR